jgi:hypothetical protein
MMRKLLLGLAVVGLAGCASNTEVVSQRIAIWTDPPGANCSLNRQGVSIARISPTPGEITVEKTKDDITIICDLEGYREATLLNRSDLDSATLGNILAGGAVGRVIDSVSGADKLYRSAVSIRMTPGDAPPPTAQTPSPAAAPAKP